EESLPTAPEAPTVAAPHERPAPAAVERPVDRGGPDRPRHHEQPVGGDRGHGVESVAGEQPAPPEGVLPKPQKPARARKPRAGEGRGAAGRGTQGAGERPDTGTGGGADQASHVDTADGADDPD